LVRKILEKVPEEQLKNDLEKYRVMALDLGATDAKVITSDKVTVDERVRAKCIYPKCDYYGTNAHCPPHALDLSFVRKLVQRYRYGIFLRIKIPSNVLIPPSVRPSLTIPKRYSLKLYEIVSKVESQAFFDGHYLSLGFGAGPCKAFFCPRNECTALKLGHGCRHYLKARGSMEGAGMDAYLMAARAGWEVFPVGVRTLPSEVPCATRLGLILIC